MYLNAKQFAETYGKPYATVKRYCKEGLFRYEHIGRTYSIDVEYALKALKERTQAAAIKPPPTPPRTRRRINNAADYLAALKELQREGAKP